VIWSMFSLPWMKWFFGPHVHEAEGAMYDYVDHDLIFFILIDITYIEKVMLYHIKIVRLRKENKVIILMYTYKKLW
jgi:hypothetical protein